MTSSTVSFTTPRLSGLLGLVLLVGACGGDPEAGTIEATVYGEAFIEEGIPAEELSDGWAIEFDAFLVSIGGITAEAGHDGEVVGDAAYRIVDLAKPSSGAGYTLTSFAAPGGDYDHYGYRLQSDGAATGVNVEAADVTAMKAAGASVWVRGAGVKGADRKTFDWAFTFDLAYGHCDLGATVDGNTVKAQATIHADHIFYDDAVSSEPAVAFQIIADADGGKGDGEVTLEELAAVDIRGETRYQVGSLRDVAGQPIVNLRQYVEHQVVTLGHINGEGHCEEQHGTP